MTQDSSPVAAGAKPCIKGDGFDTTTGGFVWIIINGFAIEAQYILSALEAQVRAEDAVDPDGLFRGLDSIRARAAISKARSAS